MERLAGIDNPKVCELRLEGEGHVYTTYKADYPYRLNLNLWNMGYYVNDQGAADFSDLQYGYDDFVYLYKSNWGEYFTGHPAEYPGKQHYTADVTCMAERDDLTFSLRSDTFDVAVIINRQAWEEYDYSWRDRHTIAMKSEMMPSNTQVEIEKAADSDVYRLCAPYANGHNIMLYVNSDSATVTMPRQYAYNDTWGQAVYATGTGTYDGWGVFDMNITFSNEDASQSIIRHEIYGEKPSLIAILGTYAASADSYFSSAGHFDWDITISSDETDVNKVWIANIEPYFGKYGYVAPNYNLFYGFANEDKTEIHIPVGQRLGYNETTLEGFPKGVPLNEADYILDSGEYITLTILNDGAQLRFENAFGIYDGGWYNLFDVGIVINKKQ